MVKAPLFRHYQTSDDLFDIVESLFLHDLTLIQCLSNI